MWIILVYSRSVVVLSGDKWGLARAAKLREKERKTPCSGTHRSSHVYRRVPPSGRRKGAARHPDEVPQGAPGWCGRYPRARQLPVRLLDGGMEKTRREALVAAVQPGELARVLAPDARRRDGCRDRQAGEGGASGISPPLRERRQGRRRRRPLQPH